MIIANSSIAMASRHEMYLKHTRQDSLVMWRDSQPRSAASPVFPESVQKRAAPLDKVSLSPEATAAAKQAGQQEELPISDMDKLELELVRRMVEMLTGKRIELMSPDEFLAAQDQGAADAQQTAEALAQAQASDTQSPEGWGMIYSSQETHYEREETVFAAQGMVTTADGQQIDISLELGMSREFMEEYQIDMRAGDAATKLTDPLVLDFGGTLAELTTTKFAFDLNSDGSGEQVSFVGSSGSLLALDLNSDGKIDNGKELFGPTTGDGYSELAKHDEDNNMWIDEKDSVFDRLQLWSKDSQGQDQLQNLRQKGVGALYLGRVATPFSIKDNDNQLQGQVRSTGLYLKEDGTAGAMQQIDLAA